MDFVPDFASDRAAVTAAIGRLIRAVMKEVNILDAIMHNTYARNPGKLRAWESASHTERASQREKPPAANVVNVTHAACRRPGIQPLSRSEA